ncbi:MAG TPA: DUF192 domain-containing protein [Thermomicrobiales bacterium]|nr:DUF192 domain-containing protein [Thermomicrobiales bacterium]
MGSRLVALIFAVLLLAPAVAEAKPAVPSWRDGHPWSTEVASVVVGTDELQAEIADTSPLQGRGLGYRDGLEPGTAMLFVFDDASMRTFWMKGMRFCLDIVWIEGEKIVGAAESVCPMPITPDADLPRYTSPIGVHYVLEVPAGWLATHGYGAGTGVAITLPDPPAG